MARLFAVDSGATARLIKRLFVVDSGGTARAIQRLFFVDSGGTARLVYVNAVQFTTTMTRGTNGDKGSPLTGFQASVMGSLTSATFFSGRTCTQFATAPASLIVKIAGTHAQQLIDHVVCSVGTFASDDATFSQSGGESIWTWAPTTAFATTGTETIEIWGQP